MAEDLAADIIELEPRLLAFARSLAGDHSEAEDLVQETCLRALGAQERFRSGTNLRAWLFTILRNLYLNRRRDAAARPALVSMDGGAADEALAARPGSHVERQVLFRAELAELVGAFRRLPSRFAIPLHLVAVEEMSYAQVAALLGIPIGTVMSRVHRARQTIMRMLVEAER